MSVFKEYIEVLVNKYEDEILSCRRTLHANPELSFQEYETASYVKSAFEEMDVHIKDGIAKTGLTVDMFGLKNPNQNKAKHLLLRADMDALPLQEENELSFKSKISNVMHACGHDVHTANLIGTAKILYELRPYWSGHVRFVFQPGEERGGGGREMIKEGILDDYDFDAAIALHTSTTIPPGKFQIGWGNIMAYSDKFNIKVIGKKAHSANPSDGVDAINIASHIVVGLNSIISKMINPLSTGTFSIGMIKGGSAPNIIASEVTIEGMMRSLDAQTRETFIRKIQQIASGITESMDGKIEFILTEGYASVYNNEILADFVYDLLDKYYDVWHSDLPKDTDYNDIKVIKQDKPLLGAEDFGFYSQRIPSVFYRVGTGNHSPAHTGQFLIDETYIKLCTKSMATIAFEYLNSYTLKL